MLYECYFIESAICFVSFVWSSLSLLSLWYCYLLLYLQKISYSFFSLIKHFFGLVWAVSQQPTSGLHKTTPSLSGKTMERSWEKHEQLSCQWAGPIAAWNTALALSFGSSQMGMCSDISVTNATSWVCWCEIAWMSQQWRDTIDKRNWLTLPQTVYQGLIYNTPWTMMEGQSA